MFFVYAALFVVFGVLYARLAIRLDALERELRLHYHRYGLMSDGLRTSTPLTLDTDPL